MKKSMFRSLCVAMSAVMIASLSACSDDDPVAVSAAIITALNEVEPANDLVATATPLSAGQAGQGSLVVPGDVDHWSIAGTAGTVLRVEVFGCRFDQPAWDAADNRPRLGLIGTDGTTLLLEHDPDTEWSWGEHDLDIEAYRLPATGVYTVRIRQSNAAAAGGLYVMTWSITDLGPIQDETEAAGVTGANDTSATAQVVTPGTISGFHVDGESDFYSFAVAEASFVSFETKAYRNGIANGDDDYYDVEIELVDTNGTTVLRNDDDSYFYDSAIQHALVIPGTYFLRVTECCGSGDAPYLLVFGQSPIGTATESEPNDVFTAAAPLVDGTFITGTAEAMPTEDWYSFTGAAGDLVRLQLLDSGLYQGSADNATIAMFRADGTTLQPNGIASGFGLSSTFLPATGTYLAQVTHSGPGTYALRLLRERTATPEVEPNDGPGATSPTHASYYGAITVMNDADVFPFPAAAGQLVRIFVYAEEGPRSEGFFELTELGSPLQATLGIRNAADTLLALSPFDGVANSGEGVVEGASSNGIAFVAPSAGVYFIEVTAENGLFSDDRAYQVVIR